MADHTVPSERFAATDPTRAAVLHNRAAEARTRADEVMNRAAAAGVRASAAAAYARLAGDHGSVPADPQLSHPISPQPAPSGQDGSDRTGQYYLSRSIDIGAAMRRIPPRPKSDPHQIQLSGMLFRAVAMAARRVPQLNGHWVDGEFRPAPMVHLGVVMPLCGRGTITDTIADAHQLDLAATTEAARAVIMRGSQLRPADRVPATVTVANLADLHIDSVFATIAAPQVAAVGFGAVTGRSEPVQNPPQLSATVVGDHRVSEIAQGAWFLAIIADLLQHPDKL